MSASPWGVIIASIIAGFIAFIGMIITKENKTSEFRQAWINELRELLANYLSLIDIMSADSNCTEEDKLNARKDVNKIIAQIRLHLNDSNPSKEESDLLESIILINSKHDDDNVDIIDYYDEFISSSHNVLKKEWIRVKDGESGYNFIKNILFVILTICISTLIISFLLHSIIYSGILSLT